jgi:hypothetical protein
MEKDIIQGPKGTQGPTGIQGVSMRKWGKYLSGDSKKKWQAMMDFVDGKKKLKELRKLDK